MTMVSKVQVINLILMIWSCQWIELIFGLSQVEYEVHEDDGDVSIGVIFAHGIPGDYTPLLLLSTDNGTAA